MGGEAAGIEIAKRARLSYVCCSDAGIRRIKRGKGFVYILPNGSLLRDEGRLQTIRQLALPPAWRDVWVCSDPNGHLLATGYDGRGRTQYRYHPKWREVRDGVKYHELEAFGRSLPRLRKRVSRFPGDHEAQGTCYRNLANFTNWLARGQRTVR